VARIDGANSLDAIGVREDGGIDWQGEGLQSERPRLLSYTCPFRASGLGHPAKRRVDPNLSDRKYGSIVVKNYSWR